MLCFSLLTCLMLKIKNCIVSIKTAQTDPTQTALVWFGSDFILKVN